MDYDRAYFDNMERTYKTFDRIRAKTIIAFMGKNAPKGGIVLDAGCGSGFYFPYISAFCGNLYGIEFSSEGAEMAKKRIPHGKGEVFVGSITEPFQLEPESVDFILCSEVLEHIEALDKVFDEFLRVLKKDGKILVTVPNFAFLSFEYLREMFFTKDPTHVHRKSKKEWERLLGKRFKIAKSFTSSFHPSFVLYALGVPDSLTLFAEKIVRLLPVMRNLGRENIFLLSKPL
ncbi:MAG: class I SAM-dependent methyltransferase [Candidatus Aenigmarchaeota archaeon]|nr:class I SAM-dependent methyltransferase [Candidatus Aenigmarchaeota archaeon]